LVAPATPVKAAGDVLLLRQPVMVRTGPQVPVVVAVAAGRLVAGRPAKVATVATATFIFSCGGER
jgi:hypothetical protein